MAGSEEHSLIALSQMRNAVSCIANPSKAAQAAAAKHVQEAPLLRMTHFCLQFVTLMAAELHMPLFTNGALDSYHPTTSLPERSRFFLTTWPAFLPIATLTTIMQALSSIHVRA